MEIGSLRDRVGVGIVFWRWVPFRFTCSDTYAVVVYSQCTVHSVTERQADR